MVLHAFRMNLHSVQLHVQERYFVSNFIHHKSETFSQIISKGKLYRVGSLPNLAHAICKNLFFQFKYPGFESIFDVTLQTSKMQNADN